MSLRCSFFCLKLFLEIILATILEINSKGLNLPIFGQLLRFLADGGLEPELIVEVLLRPALLKLSFFHFPLSEPVYFLVKVFSCQIDIERAENFAFHVDFRLEGVIFAALSLNLLFFQAVDILELLLPSVELGT